MEVDREPEVLAVTVAVRSWLDLLDLRVDGFGAGAGDPGHGAKLANKQGSPATP